MDNAAGPQLLAVCFSYGGDVSENCAGRGGNVAVGTTDGVASIMGVLICTGVQVRGRGVTGNAVGTGPIGLITFFV